MSLHRDYASSAWCRHAGVLTRLTNGETRCDSCVSIVYRADGTPVKWHNPSGPKPTTNVDFPNLDAEWEGAVVADKDGEPIADVAFDAPDVVVNPPPKEEP